MILTDIRLQQYRSYTDASFELDAGVNIVVGPNAAGKTNLLEAVMVTCTGKSYRAKDAQLIQQDKQWARIDAHTQENALRTVKLQYDPQGRVQKTLEIDEKIYKRPPLNVLHPVVLFEPNHLRLIEGDPSGRRSYMDDVIEQFSPNYATYRSQYDRVLRQRNALLKQGPRIKEQLFAWNLRLADLGEYIVHERVDLIKTLNKDISRLYKEITYQDKKLSSRYESNIPLDTYGSSLLKKLELSVETDLLRGFTGSGPHRDDFSLLFDLDPVLNSASRGELRTTVLCIKIIESQILAAKTGKTPLFLLDDVFSELDGSRRKSLTGFLKSYQTIITTTDADIVTQSFTGGRLIIPL